MHRYLNLDDGWASKMRAADGTVVPEPSLFPGGMKSLADYVHDQGLLFGLYVRVSRVLSLVCPCASCELIADTLARKQCIDKRRVGL